jgi:hypothetical protein
MVVLPSMSKQFIFLEVGCGYCCSAKVPKESFAELMLSEAFQALSKSEQDIFLMLMTQLMVDQ